MNIEKMLVLLNEFITEQAPKILGFSIKWSARKSEDGTFTIIFHTDREKNCLFVFAFVKKGTTTVKLPLNRTVLKVLRGKGEIEYSKKSQDSFEITDRTVITPGEWWKIYNIQPDEHFNFCAFDEELVIVMIIDLPKLIWYKQIPVIVSSQEEEYKLLERTREILAS